MNEKAKKRLIEDIELQIRRIERNAHEEIRLLNNKIEMIKYNPIIDELAYYIRYNAPFNCPCIYCVKNGKCANHDDDVKCTEGIKQYLEQEVQDE